MKPTTEYLDRAQCRGVVDCFRDSTEFRRHLRSMRSRRSERNTNYESERHHYSHDYRRAVKENNGTQRVKCYDLICYFDKAKLICRIIIYYYMKQKNVN